MLVVLSEVKRAFERSDQHRQASSTLQMEVSPTYRQGSRGGLYEKRKEGKREVSLTFLVRAGRETTKLTLKRSL